MTIPVFPQEISDGIAEQIKNDFSIAYITNCTLNEKLEQIIKSTADLEDYIGDFDLYPFESVLCSTGMNENDDIFLSSEMWKAKCTPVHKKINFLHDEKDIIGSIVSTRAMDMDGNSLSFDLPESDIPNHYDLVSCGLLYKVWEDPKLQERMNSLIIGMKEGKWFVSMECLFPTFDYGLMSAISGQQYIIPRNEETSMLSRYLKRYGGTGKYENYTIGRVLRNLTFSGKGIVDNPANKRSVILKANSDFNGKATTMQFLDKENNTMAEATISKQDYDKLADEVNTLKAEAKVNAEKAVANQINEAKAQVTKLEAELSATKEVAKAFETKVSTLEAINLAHEKTIKDEAAKLAKANEDLAAHAKEALKAKRLALFADVDVLPAKAQELVDKFIDSSDELFTELVTAMPKKKAESKPDSKTDDKTTSSTTVADALATASKTVESTVKTVPAVDTTKDTRAKASTWFSSMLSSSKENK